MGSPSERSNELEALLAKKEVSDLGLSENRYVDKRTPTFLESMAMQLIESFGIEKVLVFSQLEFLPPSLFHVFETALELKVETLRSEIVRNFSPYTPSPLVIGFFGFQIHDRESLGLESSLFQALESSSLIEENGIGLFMFPSFWNTFQKNRAAELFNERGLHVSAIVNTPKSFFRFTALRPLLVVVERKKRDKCFLLDATNFEAVDLSLINFFTGNDTSNIKTGVWVDLENFSGFEEWETREKLLIAVEAYKGEYELVLLKDISTEFNLCKTGGTFAHKWGAIYVPLIGNTPAVYRIEETSLKHQNYCQVVLDTYRVLPPYMASFLNSSYGRLLLDNAKSIRQAVIPKLSKSQFPDLRVAIPSMEMQQRICNFVEKFATLRKTVQQVEDDFALNPIETKMLLPKIEEVLLVFNKLSGKDRIESLIRNGESKVVEFKQTLCLDVRKGTKESYITTIVIKTAAAFLNTDGGDLLIGVNDDGKIVGVDQEIREFFGGSSDKYLLHFKNVFREQVGEPFYPLVKWWIEVVENRQVFCVNCLRSDKEVWVNGLEFYVRSNPSTDKLEGPKQIQYIRQRFG